MTLLGKMDGALAADGPSGNELSLLVDENDNRISIELAVQVAPRFGIPKKDALIYAVSSKR